MIKPGSLIKVKEGLPPFLRFAPFKDEMIQNSAPWDLWQHPSAAILVLEAFSYATATATATATAMVMATPTAMATAMAMKTAAANAATATATAAASKELEDTGEIQGHVFLLGNGKRVWISHYDLEEIWDR